MDAGSGIKPVKLTSRFLRNVRARSRPATSTQGPGRSFVELVRACGIREDLRGSTQKGYVPKA